MEKHKTNILIVDDDAAVTRFLSRALASRGFGTLTAGSAEEFISRISREPFDLALIDINLPGMNGITLTKIIKETAFACDVIIMTGDPNLENAIGALKAGAGDFLTKPFSEEMLGIVVERCLEKRMLSAELANTKAAYAQQQSLENMKNTFMSVICFELKTALTAILNGIEKIKTGEAKGTPEAVINAAEAGALRLAEVIEDILVYTTSKNPANPLHLSAADPSDLVKKAVKELEPLFKEQLSSALMSLPETALAINCEPEKMTLAIKHLIKNAVVFDSPGGVVKITLAETAGDIRLSVKDTGIGMPKERLEEIYDTFSQVDTVSQVTDFLSRKSGGLGLGLALVKQITEACKGKIEVVSSIDEGTIFTLIFPKAESVAARGASLSS